MSSHGTVSIHAPARGATSSSSALPPRRTCFNSRAREGRDRYLFGAGVAVATFQFTRPRGARPFSRPQARVPDCVSIHAPARGATVTKFVFIALGSFNSRAREGRDHCTRVFTERGWGFNSRAREGRDFRLVHRRRRIAAVSIHAPARGATLPPERHQSLSRGFQFTRPRGARHGEKNSLFPFRGFQFTRPRGARPISLMYSRETFGVSIHAPARGATQELLGKISRVDVSIHAPARGATTKLLLSQRQLSRFNSRAREGRDQFNTKFTLNITSFNSRAREGRDEPVQFAHARLRVSIHAPARGATP